MTRVEREHIRDGEMAATWNIRSDLTIDVDADGQVLAVERTGDDVRQADLEDVIRELVWTEPPSEQQSFGEGASMQRLEIVWRPSLFGTPPPLTDEAHYWEFHVRSCDDERYLSAVGYAIDGEAAGEHVVPFALVHSASARPIAEQRTEAAP